MKHRNGNPAIRMSVAVCLLFGMALAGCTSVKIPFGDLSGQTSDTPDLVTGSIETDLAASTTPMAPPLDSPATAAFTAAPQPDVSEPTQQVIAAVESTQNPSTALTQSDLNAMGAALTSVLARDANPGTFAWSNAQTGTGGVMTPFRSSGQAGERCRMVSVEVQRAGADAIVLADACEGASGWRFVTPRPGQPL